jgi:hypothetical protein
VSDEQFTISRADHDRGTSLIIHAGNGGTERVVPPAGEAHAFDRTIWRRRIEVGISPTGRSVRVWVDGEEVDR